jgi:hypothetical protein
MAFQYASIPQRRPWLTASSSAARLVFGRGYRSLKGQSRAAHRTRPNTSSHIDRPGPDVIAIRRLFPNRCQSHLARLTKQDATGLTEFASLERRAFDGITFRNTFFVVKGRESEALYFHELVHVVQWEGWASTTFYWRTHWACSSSATSRARWKGWRTRCSSILSGARCRKTLYA